MEEGALVRTGYGQLDRFPGWGLATERSKRNDTYPTASDSC